MSHVRPVQTLLEYLSGGTGKTTSLVRKMTVNGRSWTVSYDGNGNITSLADSVGGTFLYEYDALNQLTKETRPNGDVYVYGYDAGGNITTRTKNGSPLPVSYTHLLHLQSPRRRSRSCELQRQHGCVLYL